jgi:hypothetical protein
MRAYFEQLYISARTAGLHDGEYIAKELTAGLNAILPVAGLDIVRGFLFQKVPMSAKLSPQTVGMALGAYVDKWRVVGTEKLVLRVRLHNNTNVYHVHREKI